MVILLVHFSYILSIYESNDTIVYFKINGNTINNRIQILRKSNYVKSWNSMNFLN